MPDTPPVPPPLETPVLNNLVLNSDGVYKGGASDPEPDTALGVGDVFVIQFSVIKSGIPTPVVLGQIQSDPLIAPDEGKAWQWFSRDWIQQAAIPPVSPVPPAK